MHLLCLRPSIHLSPNDFKPNTCNTEPWSLRLFKRRRNVKVDQPILKDLADTLILKLLKNVKTDFFFNICLSPLKLNYFYEIPS